MLHEWFFSFLSTLDFYHSSFIHWFSNMNDTICFSWHHYTMYAYISLVKLVLFSFTDFFLFFFSLSMNRSYLNIWHKNIVAIEIIYVQFNLKCDSLFCLWFLFCVILSHRDLEHHLWLWFSFMDNILLFIVIFASKQHFKYQFKWVNYFHKTCFK